MGVEILHHSLSCTCTRSELNCTLFATLSKYKSVCMNKQNELHAIKKKQWHRYFGKYMT